MNQKIITCPATAGVQIMNVSLKLTFTFLVFINTCLGKVIIHEKTFWCDSTIAMDKCSEVVVAKGATLTLQSCILKSEGNNLWQGILVEPGGNLFLENSTIEDAEVAIAVQYSGQVHAHNSTFDKNYIDISFGGGDFSTSTIYGNTFKCTANLKAPRAHETTLHNIECKNSTGVNIGDVTQSINTFSDATMAIKSIESDLVIRNNLFKNITNQCPPPPLNEDPCPVAGVAIYAQGDQSNSYNLTVGGAAADYNTFENCTYGVYTIKGINATISFNHFDNNTTGNVYSSPALSHAISCLYHNQSGNDVTIEENFMEGFHYPIELYHHRNNNIAVVNNTVLYAQANSQALGSDIGLQLRNDVHDQSQNPAVNITGNYLLGRARGMLLTQINDASIKANYQSMLTAQSTRMQYGIRLQGSNNNVLSGNSMTRSLRPVWQDEAAVMGITIEGGKTNQLLNNTVINFGTGIRFFNCASANTLNCNTMTDFITGITIERSDIKDQGTATAASDNRWYRGNNSINNVRGINLQYNQLNSPRWYIRLGASPYDPTGFLDPPFVLRPFSGSPSPNCDEKCTDPNCQQEEVARVLQGGHSQSNPEIQYDIYKYVFETLKAKPNLMHLGTAKDFDLETFYETMKTTSMGQLSIITDTLENDTLFALLTNTNISPENNFETNAKEFNTIYLDGILSGFQYSPEQRANLLFMAYENPVSGGSTCYDARVALRMDADDYTITSLRKSAYGGITDQSRGFEIYPNPTRGKASVMVNMLETDRANCRVLDATGKLILEKEFSAANTAEIIDLSNQPKGIYFCTFILNEMEMKTIQLIVQ